MLLQPRENSTTHVRETRIFLGSGATVIVLALMLRLFPPDIGVGLPVVDLFGAITAVIFLVLNTLIWSQLGKGIVSRLSSHQPPPQPPKLKSEPETSGDEGVEEEIEDDAPRDAPVRLGVFLIALLLKPLVLIAVFVILAHSTPLFIRSFLFAFVAHLILTGGGLIWSAVSGHLTPAPGQTDPNLKR